MSIALKSLLGCAIAAAFCGQAGAVTITFDDAVAGYTPTPGTTQEVTNQFASLGVVFEDRKSPGHGATLGNCGPGDGPVSLFGFGADFPGCGDTRPNLDLVFVDPTNAANKGFTTSFSLHNFDGLIQATAYDASGSVLGTTSTSAGLLAFAGVGNISRVNLLSLDNDPTTLDTLTFDAVQAVAAVPEPTTYALMLGGLAGLAALRRRRN